MGYNARTWAEAGPQRRRAAPDRHSEGTQLRPPGRLTPHAHTSAEAGPHSAAKEHSLGVPGSGHRNAGKGKRGFRRQSRPSLQGCSNHVPQSCFLDVADCICPHNSWLLRKSSWNGSSFPGPAAASHNHSFRSSPPSVVVFRTAALPVWCCFAVACSLGLVVDSFEPVLRGIADRPSVAFAVIGSLGESNLA